MLFKEFGNKIEEGDWMKISWSRKRGDVLGIGITQETFQGEGKELVEMERLKICFNGSEIEQAVMT
uniref:Uncharacterized protein n=1 Tax=Amphimedon queenslandica TaxID=400682 RepID=A0A1X7T0J4_AMPQE